MGQDENGNIDCVGCRDCRGCIKCHNSVGCHNSAWCDNSVGCDNSTECHNSTWCDNSANRLYCCDLVLAKYCVFNQQVSKQEFEEIKAKIWKGLPYHLHPKNLSTENVAWLKKNVKQFNQKVLDEIVAQSVLPNKSVVIQEKED